MPESPVQPETDAAPAADPNGGRRPPSILILTKNEELNIRACLECFRAADDVVVLDSYSDDRTCEIAEEFSNVRVIKRVFDTWSQHSNWALDHIDFKHPWVYYSDADERVPPELWEEILTLTNDPERSEVAWRLRYKNMFMNRWIRRGGVYPVWIIRLFRPDKVRYEDREVNAHPVVDGEMGDMKEHFIHYSFNKGLVPWFRKHNSYSQMEAHEALRVLSGSFADEMRATRSPDKAVRRRAIKNLSFFLPFRGFIRFLYMYFAQFGFLDGRAGFHYACMVSMYEYWIELKGRELRSKWPEETLALTERMLEDPAA